MAIALTSGMRQNLIALQSVNGLMETTQNRLSTGKKVNSALDDPVNFFKAEDHYNRASDLAAKKGRHERGHENHRGRQYRHRKDRRPAGPDEVPGFRCPRHPPISPDLMSQV